MKTFIGITLVGLLGAGAPASGDPCTALGELAEAMAEVRDAGGSRELAESTLILTLGDEPAVVAIIRDLGQAVYVAGPSLDGALLGQLAVSACRESLEGQP